MAEASIPVDLLNPGQVFACLGFLETADALLGNAHGSFDWGRSGDRFLLSADGERNPFETALAFVATADVIWLSPRDGLAERDGGTTEVHEPIAASVEPKAADLPGLLRGRSQGEMVEIPFGYWADGSSRFSTTFKKSTNGASSHIRFKNAQDAVREMSSTQAESDPLNQAARTESLFRLDPRGSVDPIHGGFSPDGLRKGDKGGLDMRVATYPVCELFAVLGFEHARPERLDSHHFAYCVWNRSLPPVLARAAIGGQFAFGEVRRFVVEHEEVKTGGDRKMNHVTEELRTWQA
jgi:CRISPR-associated protein Csx14